LDIFFVCSLAPKAYANAASVVGTSASEEGEILEEKAPYSTSPPSLS